MPIAASVQGLGVHLRTTKATKSAALSQLADKETNTRTTKSRHEEKLLHAFRMPEKGWQTIKKAGVYAFLEQLAQFYEIIVYSDYSYMHVDPVMPVMERLDTKHCVTYKLGKAATMYQIAEETYTTQTAALETAMSTPVFV
ncbi:hypothetical protein FF1_039683 [Malus domestica]